MVKRPPRDTLVILGVDPGTASTGYGLLECRDGEVAAREYGCIHTKAGEERGARLHEIHSRIEELLREFTPDCLAMERVFFNKNVLSVMQVGEAAGVIRLAAAQAQVPVYEYSPPQIKQVLAGYGRTDKKKLSFLIAELLGLAQPPRPSHAADALACALCHFTFIEGQESLEESP